MQSKEWKVILNVMTLDAENDTKYPLRHELLRHNYIWGEEGRLLWQSISQCAVRY